MIYRSPRSPRGHFARSERGRRAVQECLSANKRSAHHPRPQEYVALRAPHRGCETGGKEEGPSWLKVSSSEYPDASGSERSRTMQSKVWFLRRRRHSAAVAAATVSTSCEPNSLRTASR